MARTKESLSWPQAVEVLGDASCTKALRQAAADRIAVALEESPHGVVIDIGHDLLHLIHDETR